MLKRHLLTLTLAASVAAMSAAALAQDNSSGSQQSAPQAATPEHHMGHGHFDPEKRSEMMAKHLDLTSDQQAKVLDILKAEQSQMESLRSDTSVAPEDRRSKMMDIHKTSSDQIRALLNADQQKKWDEMQSHRQQWQGHGGMGKAPDSTPQN